MKYVWLTLVGVFVVAAATFLWWGRTDSAFVAATLAVLAWFLDYRRRLRQIVSDSEEDSSASKDSIDEE